MDAKLQERNFLLLTNDPNTEIVKKILKSPLGLAKQLIINLNENRFSSLTNDLDKIKLFVAGIDRTESLKDYRLAKFYPTMFAFHQYFNSSFRARQGKVLEVVLQEILRKHTESSIVPYKVADMQKIIQDIFTLDCRPSLDVDALANDETNKKVIIIQIRSRDDTGGTTAKGSLVDFLRELLRTYNESDYRLTYLIAVWDERRSQQKNATITKMYASLKDHMDVEESVFKKNIEEGVMLKKNIILKMAYGTDQIAKALFVWDETDNEDVLESIKRVTNSIANWDDLWISYAISSLEIETFSFYGKFNISILENHLSKENIILDNDFNANLIDNISLNIASKWKEDTIPLSSVSDKILYIRDLIYLKLIYNRINI